MKNFIKNFIIFSFVFSWLFFGGPAEKAQTAAPIYQAITVPTGWTQATNSPQFTGTAADDFPCLDETTENVQSESGEVEILLDGSGTIMPEQANDPPITTEKEGKEEIVGNTSVELPVAEGNVPAASEEAPLAPETEQTEPAEPIEQTGEVKKIEPGQEIQPSEVNLKVFNKGESKSGANKVSELLADKEYLKMETGEGKGKDIIQTLIFFNEEKFRIPAQNLRELLIREEKIYSAVMIAETDEEKSTDIVIMLGKFKEAPPN